jgi:hypothetical protein
VSILIDTLPVQPGESFDAWRERRRDRNREPLTSHFPHPHDDSQRTALCGRAILGVPAFGEYEVCVECAVLHMAGDYAVLS